MQSADPLIPHYKTPAIAPRSPRSAFIIAAIDMGLILLASLLLAYTNFSSLWPLPRGTPIRPMALAALNILSGGLMLLISVALSILALALTWRRKYLWLPLSLFLASFAPLLTALAVFNWIIAHHGLVLDP